VWRGIAARQRRRFLQGICRSSAEPDDAFGLAIAKYFPLIAHTIDRLRQLLTQRVNPS
jgi:hypothetical protein